MDDNKLAYVLLNIDKPDSCLRLTNRQSYIVKQELEENNLSYTDLYDPQVVNSLDLSRLRNSNSVKEKINKLLKNRAEIAWKLENWQQAGIAILTQIDHQYPPNLVKKLEDKAPAIIFALGNISNLTENGLAVVGSRDIDQEIEEKTQQVSKFIVENGFTVISGGAIGIDRVAMQSALDHGGKVIGFLKRNFSFQNLSRSGWNKFIEDASLTLLTEVSPDQKMDRNKVIATAMNRNKYIYALAEFGIIIASDVKGGTWQGAEEQIKKFKRNIFVVSDKIINKPGNKKMIEELHALKLPDLDNDFVLNLNNKYKNWYNQQAIQNLSFKQMEIDFN